MISKNELKYIQSLCQKKQRAAEGVFIAEGPKLAEELLASNYKIIRGYATASWLAENKTSKGFTEVTEIELEKMTGMQTANQVILIVEQKNQKTVPDLSKKLSLVLDGIQDPGNLGTIIRIADWFGITQIIASEDTVDLYNLKVVQSTMGSFIRVSVYYTDIVAFLTATKLPVFGAMLEGMSMYELQKPATGLLVIGNESKGIREPIQPLIKQAVTIPKLGGAESLNAAIATGILVSHMKA
jgi:RNA methyltransferase, TrmH family